MATTILIISAILFIVSFGIHATITNQDKWEQPMYVDNLLLGALPWISGFILPVIPLTIVFDVNWVAVFFINLATVWFLGPILTKGF